MTEVSGGSRHTRYTFELQQPGVGPSIEPTCFVVKDLASAMPLNCAELMISYEKLVFPTD